MVYAMIDDTAQTVARDSAPSGNSDVQSRFDRYSVATPFSSLHRSRTPPALRTLTPGRSKAPTSAKRKPASTF